MEGLATHPGGRGRERHGVGFVRQVFREERPVLAGRLQPQAGTVGIGQLTHRGQDEFLQLAYVALRGERDADPVQLLELPVLTSRLLLELFDLLLENSVLQRHA